MPSLPLKVSTSPFGRRRTGWTVQQVGADGLDLEAGDRVDEVQPVGADVGHRPQLAALGREDAPVVVGVEEQPVLHVAAGHVVDLAELAAAHPLAGLDRERVEADVVVDARGLPRVLAGEGHELGRLLRGHGQRLLAQHVLAGLERGLRHLEVQLVRRADVDRLDRLVVEQLLQRAVGLRCADRRGELRGLGVRDTEDAHDLAARPPQRLGVHPAHEPRPDDRHADPRHALLLVTARSLQGAAAAARGRRTGRLACSIRSAS